MKYRTESTVQWRDRDQVIVKEHHSIQHASAAK